MLQDFLLHFQYHWNFMRNIKYCLMLHDFLIKFEYHWNFIRNVKHFFILHNVLIKFEYHWSFLRNIEYCLMLHDFLINFISICLILHFAFFAWVPQLFVSSNSVNKQTIINFNLICIWYWLAPVGRIMGHKKDTTFDDQCSLALCFVFLLWFNQ